MATINDIRSFIIRDIIPDRSTDETENYLPQINEQTAYSASEGLIEFDFIDPYTSDNKSDLYDGEIVGWAGSNDTNSFTNGTHIQIDGEPDYYAQSLWRADFVVKLSNGEELLFERGARLITLGVSGSPNTLTGDVIVNPLDSSRAAINDYLSANPGVKLESFRVSKIHPGSDESLNNTSIDKQDDPFNICFTTGTLIETDRGDTPVEDLRPGDMIRTMDDGCQPVRWIGSTRRDAVDLANYPKLRPVRIPAGALGGGLPKRDLMVSRQHRVLIRSKIVQRMFGTGEILVPAIRLAGFNGIGTVEDCTEVTYFHILFDKHQVIFSEGAPTESLFTGPMALKGVSPEARREIETLFPEIVEPGFVPLAARLMPGSGKMIKRLIERHAKQDKPML